MRQASHHHRAGDDLLTDKVLEQLQANVFPMTAAELARALPGTRIRDIEEACHSLRKQQRLGRNGADTPSSPYRFYIQRVAA